MSFYRLIGCIMFLASFSGCSSTGSSFGVERLGLDSAGYNPEKALLIGVISEGYLFQPHFPVVFFKSTEINPETEKFTTFGVLVDKEEDIDPSKNVKASAFAIELPPGEYYINGWRYIKYSGKSMEIPNAPTFTLKAGDVAFLGEMRAIALNMCLKIYDNNPDNLPGIFKKYPFLKEASIRDLTAEFDLRQWPHQQYASKVKDFKCALVQDLF